MGLGKPPKYRELIHYLRRYGAKPLRQRGSHEVWQLPNGRTFSLVVNHINDPVSRTVLKNVSDALGYVPEC
jgi:predicted RNA binding protein YcfA (HicA-like mRNA interferase family)